jgi:hypothetical protein
VRSELAIDVSERLFVLAEIGGGRAGRARGALEQIAFDPGKCLIELREAVIRG